MRLWRRWVRFLLGAPPQKEIRLRALTPTQRHVPEAQYLARLERAQRSDIYRLSQRPDVKPAPRLKVVK
jgi:hypothetical protein